MRKKLRLPMWGAALVLLAGALLFTAAALLIQPGSISVRLHSFAAQPLLLVLNLLPALLGSLFLWCLCGNPFFAAAGAGLIVDLLSYVNLIKTGCRNDPPRRTTPSICTRSCWPGSSCLPPQWACSVSFSAVPNHAGPSARRARRRSVSLAYWQCPDSTRTTRSMPVLPPA